MMMIKQLLLQSLGDMWSDIAVLKATIKIKHAAN